MNWTEKDDIICCYEYLKYSLKDNMLKEYNSLLDRLACKLPHLLKESIKMKIQNIKQLCNEYHIPDTIDIKPLANYSVQNRDVFRWTMVMPEIEKLINDRKNEIEKTKVKDVDVSIDDIRKTANLFKNKIV